MKEVKQFFSSQIKSICLLFTIVVGGFWTLSSCSPPCGEGDPYGNLEECSVTADATSDGGSTGGSSGGGGDTTAPTVQSVTPANSVTSIAVADNITVTFSEAMQSSTVDNTTITLTDSGTTVPTTVSYSNNVATINPNVVNGGLLWNTQYTVNVSTEVKDAAGNALASAYSSSFTTAVLPIPTNFTATADNASRISIAWDAMPGVSNYKVTYGTVSSSCCFTTASSPSNNTHAFNGLSSSTTYYLKVRSQNGTGTTFQWGDWSNVVTVTTP